MLGIGGTKKNDKKEGQQLQDKCNLKYTKQILYKIEKNKNKEYVPFGTKNKVLFTTHSQLCADTKKNLLKLSEGYALGRHP